MLFLSLLANCYNRRIITGYYFYAAAGCYSYIAAGGYSSPACEAFYCAFLLSFFKSFAQVIAAHIFNTNLRRKT